MVRRNAGKRKAIIQGGRNYFKKRLSRAAAATLGFAAGNIPGAVAGYGLETARQSFMSKRMRGSKRRYSKGSKPTQYKPGVKRYKAKATRSVRGKSVSVSKKFRSMVQKAMHPTDSIGTHKVDFFGGSVAESQFGYNKQIVWTGCPGTQDGNYHWTVDDIVNASCVLWNGGLMRANPTTFHQPNFSARWAESYNMKLEVIDSFSEYEVTNTSLYAIHLKAVCLKPKEARSFVYDNQLNFWAFNNTLKTYVSTVAANNVFGNSIDEWARALAVDKGTENLATGDSGAFAALDVYRRGLDPQHSIALKGMFAMSTLQDSVIQPGQTVKIKLAGPRMLTIDMEKFHEHETYNNIQPKFTRSIIFIAKLEQVRGATSGGGFLADTSLTAALVVNRKDFIKFKIPDRAPELATKNVTIWDSILPVAAPLGLPERPSDETVVPV